MHNYKCSNLQTLPNKFVFLVSFYLQFSFPGVRLDDTIQSQSIDFFFFKYQNYSLFATRKVFSMNSLLSCILFSRERKSFVSICLFFSYHNALLEQNSLAVNLCRFSKTKCSSTNMSNWHDQVVTKFIICSI